MNRSAEEMKSKYPDDNDLDGFINAKRIEFYEMKDSVKTVAEKIKLDAQNRAHEGEKSVGFYTEMFTHVLKMKILNFVYLR